MKREKYHWQGKPVINVAFGYVKVKEDKVKPLMWFNYEIDIDGSQFYSAALWRPCSG